MSKKHIFCSQIHQNVNQDPFNPEGFVRSSLITMPYLDTERISSHSFCIKHFYSRNVFMLCLYRTGRSYINVYTARSISLHPYSLDISFRRYIFSAYLIHSLLILSPIIVLYSLLNKFCQFFSPFFIAIYTNTHTESWKAFDEIVC